jgi:hypothetical protein
MAGNPEQYAILRHPAWNSAEILRKILVLTLQFAQRAN